MNPIDTIRKEANAPIHTKTIVSIAGFVMAGYWTGHGVGSGEPIVGLLTGLTVGLFSLWYLPDARRVVWDWECAQAGDEEWGGS